MNTGPELSRQAFTQNFGLDPRARAEGTPEAGFSRLLDWVKAHPLHTSWGTAPSEQEDANDDPKFLVTCAGLESFFDDPGYIEWVGRQKSGSPAHPADLLAQSVCAAAGEDIYKGARVRSSKSMVDANTGRRGRILSLLALGATVDCDLGASLGSGNPLGWAAKFAGASLVRFLVEHGAPINGRHGSDVPLIAAMLNDFRVSESLDAVRILLEAGADPNIQVTYPSGLKDSPIKRAGKNKEMLALLRGGKLAPAAKQKAGGLDTAPARAAWKKRKAAFSKAEWADGDEDLDAFFDRIDADGTPTWEAASEHLESLDPNELLMLAFVLEDVATPSGKPTKITKKDHQKARIVVGDAIVIGDALLGTGTDWVVSGDLHLEGRFAHDEAARIAVGGSMTGTMVESEGELLVGGDLRIDAVVWTEYMAGSLVVLGTLETKVLIEKEHVVTAVNRRVEHQFAETTLQAVGDVFPKVAFKDDELDGKKLWRILSEVAQKNGSKSSANWTGRIGDLLFGGKKSTPKKK